MGGDTGRFTALPMLARQFMLHEVPHSPVQFRIFEEESFSSCAQKFEIKFRESRLTGLLRVWSAGLGHVTQVIPFS
jgi:hypothetical protein